MLVDPASFTVEWANEAALEDVAPGSGGDRAPTLDDVVPLAARLGVRDALSAVAADGLTRHLQTDVVATAARSVVLVVSVHRLPDGRLLVLAEHTVRGGEPRGAAGQRRSGRQPRVHPR